MVALACVPSQTRAKRMSTMTKGFRASGVASFLMKQSSSAHSDAMARKSTSSQSVGSAGGELDSKPSTPTLDMAVSVRRMSSVTETVDE